MSRAVLKVLTLNWASSETTPIDRKVPPYFQVWVEVHIPHVQHYLEGMKTPPSHWPLTLSPAEELRYLLIPGEGRNLGSHLDLC